MSTAEQPKDAPRRPLPVLPVLHPALCSQEIADKAIPYAAENNAELVDGFLLEERYEPTSDYFNLGYELIDFLGEQGIETPATDLGKAYLIHEFSRRLRKAYDYPDRPLRGHAMAPGPQGPFPPLPALPVMESSIRRGNVTQEMADRVLGRSYAERPDIWYAASEECRIQMLVYGIDALQAHLRAALAAEYPAATSHWTQGELYLEAVMRMYKLCGIEEGA